MDINERINRRYSEANPLQDRSKIKGKYLGLINNFGEVIGKSGLEYMLEGRSSPGSDRFDKFIFHVKGANLDERDDLTRSLSYGEQDFSKGYQRVELKFEDVYLSSFIGSGVISFASSAVLGGISRLGLGEEASRYFTLGLVPGILNTVGYSNPRKLASNSASSLAGFYLGVLGVDFFLRKN